MSPSYWCASAWLGGAEPASSVRIDTAHGVITEIEADAAARAGDIRLEGLVLPGLANVHSHAFHRALRGRTHRADGGSFWTWREEMYGIVDQLTPERYLALATAVFAEMALAGITLVGEFHYVHDGSNEMGDAVVEAARRAGVRICLIDVCYLHGGIGQERTGAQQRFGDGSVDAWVARMEGRRGDDRVGYAAAIHSVRAVSPDECAVVADWARQRGRPLHAHVSEQPAENDAALEAFGRTPTEVLADAGALDVGFCAVHATHLSDRDVQLLGSAGAHIGMCPTTERDLADGVAPLPALTAAGARITVGSDSNAVIDLFEEARAVELDERLVSGVRGRFDPVDLLAAASSTGADALGRSDCGRLEVGAVADLVALDLDTPRLAGLADEHAVSMAVFAATAADVRDVVVAGEPLVTDRRHRFIDDVPEALRVGIGAVVGGGR